MLYIAKGNFYSWGKYLETSDGVSSELFTRVLDVSFRPDGERIAISLDREGYAMGLFIVILNKDGSIYSSFKETYNLKGKVNITGLVFDSSDFITAAIDSS